MTRTGERVVVIADHPSADIDIEGELLKSSGLAVRVADPARPLREQVADAVAIMTCFALVPGDAIAAATGLKTVARYGVGVDNIAVADASARGIPVSNVPVYCEDEVAEHAIALLFAAARGIAVLDRDVRAGGWSIAPSRPLRRITGRTLGLIGLGRTGQAVARRAAALGLTVIAHSPNTADARFADAGVERVGLDELLERADFVSLHTALTPQKRHLIGARELSRMRRDAILVNVARGGLVDDEALVDALRSGRIAGAAIDVFDPEVMPTDHPLRSLDNAIVTPHAAYYSEESMATLRRTAAENVIAVLEGRHPVSLVNETALAAARSES